MPATLTARPHCFKQTCPEKPVVVVPVMPGATITACATHTDAARDIAQTGRRS